MIAASLVATATGAAADTSPPTGSSLPTTVSADPLPTVQQNGVVWAQVLVGNTVYATGSFSETYPAGQSATSTNQTARSNLLAYNITTGDLVQSFDVSLNAQGLGITASPDGSTLYVVGDFTKVADTAQATATSHKHIVAINLSTGKVDTSFKASLSSSTVAVTATNSTVYVGGTFTQSGSADRSHLAAFDASGALTTWAPSADAQVDALTLTPDGKLVVIGGRFATLNGVAESGIGAVDATNDGTGTPQQYTINTIVKDGDASGKCGITSLTTEGNTVFGTGFSYGCGNFEGRFAVDADTGKPIWIDDCHGDSYGTVPIGQVLYSVSHAHDCSAIGSFPDKSAPGGNQRALAETTYATGKNTGPDSYGWNYAGQPDATVLQWFPKLAAGSVTGQNQAAWSIVGNADYLALGGEFPSVNGVAQAGLVRFAVRSDAPNTEGPIAATGLTPTATSTSSGTVNLSWTATWDQDNQDLTYAVKRDGTKIATLHQSSTFWQLPTMTYTDTGLAPQSMHSYRITATDPLGNVIASSNSPEVTVSDSGNPPPTNGPVASFTTSCSQATCQFDGTGSSDSNQNASISSYSWDFGDGTPPATGSTVAHTYTTSGSHIVSLTVKDTTGAQNTVSQTVTTTPPPAVLVAQDTFHRTSSSGWGEADAGGLWQPSGCGKLSIADKTGYFVAKRAQRCYISLSAVHRLSTDSTTGLTLSKRPSKGMYLNFLGRQLSGTVNIRLQLHVLPNGHVRAEVIAQAGNKTHVLGKSFTLRSKYGPHSPLRMRLQVSGTTPTTVRAKIWTGNTEPAAWTMSGKTSIAALQHKGTIGYLTYLSKGGPASVTLGVSSLKTTLVEN